MDKKQLIQHIVLTLEAVHKNAIAAANRAHSSATDKENVAENKYDTLGLEAAYLAEGQARRVIECEEELKAFQDLLLLSANKLGQIGVGSWVKLEDEYGKIKHLFLGASAGGLKVDYLGCNILIITDSAPLGKALLGLGVDDEVNIKIGQELKRYFVVDYG